MRTASKLEVVDTLAALASGAEPAALDEHIARRMIERAAASGAGVELVVRGRRLMRFGAAAGAFALAIACVALLVRRGPEPALIEVALPTGDRLVGTAGARFELERVERADRRVHLRAGTMLFDVAHVVAGQHFAVEVDGGIEVVATGTVFSVGVDAASARVHVYVYEGRIEVHADGRVVATLGVGGSWPADASGDPPAMLAAADAAVSVRAAEARLVSEAGSATAVAPAPAPVAATDSGSASAPVTAIGSGSASTVASTSPSPSPSKLTSTSTSTATSPSPTIATTESPDLLAARADLAAGRFDDALAQTSDRASGAWLLVRADALRALHRVGEAADAYDTAASHLAGVERAEAIYTAAYVRFHDLDDPAAALATLGDLDAPGAPLEERGLALRIQLLHALGRTDDARAAARRYVARFPDGDLSAFARKLTK